MPHTRLGRDRTGNAGNSLPGAKDADSLVPSAQWLFTPFDLSVLYSPKLE